MFLVADGPATLSFRLPLIIWQESRPDISDMSSESLVAETDSRTDCIVRSTSEAEWIDHKGRFEGSGGVSEDECCQEEVRVICGQWGDG